MNTIVYLHGYGSINPEAICQIYAELSRLLNNQAIHCVKYHPGGEIEATEIEPALRLCAGIAETSETLKINVVGYSFGGLLASLFMERMPDKVGKVILLAPAIDNFDRNYKSLPKAEWGMPETYVENLKALSPRPKITRPTWLFHGMRDNDDGGSAPWRMKEWIAEENFEQAYLLPDVDHSLEPWLTHADWRAQNPNTPSFQDALEWLLSPLDE